MALTTTKSIGGSRTLDRRTGVWTHVSPTWGSGLNGKWAIMTTNIALNWAIMEWVSLLTRRHGGMPNTLSRTWFSTQGAPDWWRISALCRWVKLLGFHDALKHLKNLWVLERKCPWNCLSITIYFYICYLLQVIFIHYSNSWLLVDEADNGKFRLQRVKSQTKK